MDAKHRLGAPRLRRRVRSVHTVVARPIADHAVRSGRTVRRRAVAVAVARRARRGRKRERAALRPAPRARYAATTEVVPAEERARLAVPRVALDAARAAVGVGVRVDLRAAAAARGVVASLPVVAIGARREGSALSAGADCVGLARVGRLRAHRSVRARREAAAQSARAHGVGVAGIVGLHADRAVGFAHARAGDDDVGLRRRVVARVDEDERVRVERDVVRSVERRRCVVAFVWGEDGAVASARCGSERKYERERASTKAHASQA